MSFREWDVRKLTDLCTKITKGTTPSTVGGKFVESGVKYYKSQCISNEKYLDNSKIEFITKEIHKKLKRSQLEENDIMFSMAGAYLGKTCIVKKSNLPGNTNQAAAIVRVDDSKVYYEFIYYYLNLNSVVELVNKSSSQSAQPNINLKQIGDIIVPYPQIKTQKAISHILSTLDEKIEVNNQINKTLEKMAQAIFKQWFVDFEFPNEDGEPYQTSGGEMVESELGLVPKGWEVSSIDELTELIIDYRGKTPKKLGRDWSETGIIALSAKSIKNGRLVNLEQANRVDEELYSIWMKDELKYGDILMTSEAPLGELYYLASDDKYCLSQRLFAIRAEESKMKSEVLFMFLKSSDVMKDIQNRATGTTVTGIRQSELRKVMLIKPDEDLQNEFQRIVSKILKKINLNERENVKLCEIRDRLLPKLMSGKIRVSYDEIKNEVS